ncbi:hypothetical protein PTKIN_Ptkin16aG0094700 [Pterospermum kingtungense]
MATRRNEYWPDDVVNSILLKLPVKSIIRFKCVAKTWSSLFENPSFVSQHLSISKEINNRILIYRPDDHKDERFFLRLYCDQTLASYQDLSQQIRQHADTRNLLLGVRDGLLCLCDTNNSHMSLWNPATRKFRRLPECNENIPSKVETYMHHIGFGSDSFTNDYKVIYVRRYRDWARNEHLHLAVYRMSTDAWRLLQVEDFDFLEDLYVPGNHSNTYVNGVHYCVAWKKPVLRVLAFHFRSEVFQLIDWPQVPVSTNGELLGLPDNRISLWVADSGMISISYDIWVLIEDEHYWTKLLRIGPLSGVQRMLGSWNKKGNMVYVESVGGQFLVYDLDTQEFKDTGANINRGLHRLYFYPFEDSLIDVSRDQAE